MKVIFIDDELKGSDSKNTKLFDDIFRNYFGTNNYRSFHDPNDAYKTIVDGGFDVDIAFIDYYLADNILGSEVGIILSKLVPNIALIVLSGDDGFSQCREAMRHGFNDYLKKSDFTSGIVPVDKIPLRILQEIDRIILLPSVKAKLISKNNLQVQIERATNAETKNQETWESFVESLNKRFSIEQTAWTYIRLILIEKSYQLTPNLGYDTLNYVVPFLQDKCDELLKGYSLSISSLRSPNRKQDRLSRIREIIPLIENLINSLTLNFDEYNKSADEFTRTWQLRKSKDDGFKSTNTITSYFNSFDVSKRLKTVKIFLNSDESQFTNIKNKIPELSDVVKLIKSQTPIL